ncbi:hypothetical protein RclHR1_12120007 [Rhizophagus clarus]|uniref:Protein kinase domain-containing protein n=1 Tax=Rhizophagus clarus TaxID=94130 RepID=A0A2Z6Q6B9_9GLOM|nr:hypothetical protein RclHR1_12120007 [Rhizophagus clarus]
MYFQKHNQEYLINSFAYWTSENKRIDDFIQKTRLKIRNYDDIVFEWVPYNQFNEIKETGKNGLATVYSAIWKDGPLCYNNQYSNYARESNKEVALKSFHNSRNSIGFLINEAEKYSTKNGAFLVLYGISQNPDTNDYILVQDNLINLVNLSGNEKIDDFIQETQFKKNEYDNAALEWIPYNQFDEVKEMGKNDLITAYSAIWKDGPLYYNNQYNNYTRDSNKKVALKCLNNSQNSIDFLINEAKKYSSYEAFLALYGISQNPITNDYILVQNNSMNLVNWNSKNEKIDDFIQERQLKINYCYDVIFEWIPYNQFNEIKETGRSGHITIYSAIWKDGPLYWSNQNEKYVRDSNKVIALKCLHNLQDPIGFLINEAKKYLTKYEAFLILYGISQNPDTNDYILVQNNSINLVNWISGNEQIDNFIKEMQLKINHFNVVFNVVFEWIPYSQFSEIKKTGKSGHITVYSAIWKDGPLHYNNQYNNYIRDSPNKEVTLKYLHNLQESINFLIIEAKKYLAKYGAGHVLYGISQNPDTKDYILALTWTSGNEKIDDFIQEMQLKMDVYKDTVFEWIPYNQFNEIKKTGKNGLITVYSAIWKDGPLYYNNWDYKYTRYSNKEIALKCLHKLQDPHNSQDPIDILINEAKKYLIKFGVDHVLYGISQNPNSEDYILVYNWTSGNEKIDDFIQEIQLQKNRYNNTVFEWIPYIRFNEIKKTGKNGYITIFSAIWKNDPLNYDNSQSNEYHISWRNNYSRNPSNKEVALKCLHNSQISIDILINEAKKYLTKYEMDIMLYGISQNPDTGDYILVLTWTSGNEKIDNFIKEMKLKKNKYDNIIFEWIPYNQFDEIKKTGKNGLITVYSAIWKGGPLCYNNQYSNYARDPNKEVALKCLHNSQESIDFLINETKKYSTKYGPFLILYGISQNPDTEDYILVLNWTSGNERIDDFIQEIQLETNKNNNTALKWIPYNQFNKVKEIGKNSLMTIYSSTWNGDPLCNNNQYSNYVRDSNKEVTLKCLHNSQESIDLLISDAKKYLTEHTFLILYGISQNPDTNNYILIQNNLANWISGNERIDDFILEMQLKKNDYNNTVFEWIPYNQFNKIKEIGKNGLITVHSAIWKDGPLCYDNNHSNYTRNSNKKITLKYLLCKQNSLNPVDFLINEAKKYSTEHKASLILYGISQNPDTNNYILVQNSLANWISGNEKIDDFIQVMQLKKNDYNNSVFEWIPYSQFNEIKEIGKNDHTTVYSAIWKDGPLYYNNQHNSYIRDSLNEEVTLKCFHNSQKPIDFLINETKKYSTEYKAFLVLYGISQDPYTNNYILVQNSLANWISGNEKIDDFIQEMQLKKNKYGSAVFEWIPYNQFILIKEIGKNNKITVDSAIWKDGPLYEKNQLNKYYTRDSNKEVALKYLHNLQNSAESLINEVKKYSTIEYKGFLVLYGISQNPDTNDYVLVQNNFVNLTNWISGNEKIDDFIQEMQLKINNHKDVIFEWIPYNQFHEVKEAGKNGFITVYSALWKDGPLYWNKQNKKYVRNVNKTVTLKCLQNLQESIIDILISESRKYSTEYKANLVLYGISQNPNTKDYILVLNWTSGNEKIDNFIQGMQLKKNKHGNTVFEWIPYSQFNEITSKKTGRNGLMPVYSAIWKDGPSYWNEQKKKYGSDVNKAVTLKYLQKSIDILIDEAEKYLTKYETGLILYGISQNPNTEDYILVLTWTSGNEKIDGFIQSMQLKKGKYSNTVFEWIPYSQFSEIKETGKNGLITIYSAIWKDGPLLHYNDQYDSCKRDSNKEVALKCLYNSQNPIYFLINEVLAKKYSTKHGADLVLYGISQNPDTDGYILVFNWTSGSERIDDFIQETRLELKIYNYGDIVFEWIPYNLFNEIKETGKNGLITIYSAIWRDGPLCYNDQYDNYIRDSNKEVALKCLHNSQNHIDFLIDEAKKCLTKYLTKYEADFVLYGISQNPDTEDYILVLNWTSGNDIIDDFIIDMRLKINYSNDIIFEWILYDQFNVIKEIGKGGFSTVYSAKWKNGPLEYDTNKKLRKRNPDRIIALKFLHNSQNITNKFLNEAKGYSIARRSNIINIYGISQNPITKDYIFVLEYAKDGNFNEWMNENYEYFIWQNKLSALLNIINGLKEIHQKQKQMVHRDFHTGNILFLSSIDDFSNCISISDMGLYGEVDNVDEEKIYGVMPYVAPEVLRGKHYTQAADIYSFGIIMYFVATGKQPFYNRAHDGLLALDICKGVRPEIDIPEAPKCYIDLMKKCWDSNPSNRPSIIEISELISSFHKSYGGDMFMVENEEIEMQFNEAEEYRKKNLSSIKNYQAVTHPQAIYISRSLNSFTKDLPKNNDCETECLDCKI